MPGDAKIGDDAATGFIEHVDVTARELTVLVDGSPQVFEVAPDCVIHLHGERVKLRMLLPRDFVQLFYTQDADGKTVTTLRVP